MSEKVTLTNRQILNLYAGLKGLDGMMSGTEFVRFEFADNIAWNISKNLTIVEAAVTAYERRKSKIFLECKVSPGQQVTSENAAEVAACMEKIEALKDQTNELTGILFLKRADLKCSENKIPPSVRAQLDPIIRG